MYFLYCLIPYDYFVILCNLFLHYVLFLHYMLLLFLLPDASYCTVYLSIILIYTIDKLNVSIVSIACASYFIQGVILLIIIN